MTHIVYTPSRETEIIRMMVDAIYDGLSEKVIIALPGGAHCPYEQLEVEQIESFEGAPANELCFRITLKFKGAEKTNIMLVSDALLLGMVTSSIFRWTD